MLARREVIQDIATKMGAMREFWWEFTARVSRSGYTIQEFRCITATVQPESPRFTAWANFPAWIPPFSRALPNPQRDAP